MKIYAEKLSGVFVVEPAVFEDERGWFCETYSRIPFETTGISAQFVQDNHALSLKARTLRGLHFQKEPFAQAKLVRCTHGKVLDVIVDLRKASPTYQQHVTVELSEQNKKQVFIPKGFAHGYLTLCDNVEVQYKVDQSYCPEYDGGIRFDDPDISINWNIEEPVLSEKDKNLPFWRDCEVVFSYSPVVLVSGIRGQLGCAIADRLRFLQFPFCGVDIGDIDITDYQQVSLRLERVRPDVVIHCAAYTAVDKAEKDRDSCYAANVTGTRNIAMACKAVNAKLVYISTDYVFSGDGDAPFHPESPAHPINYYGETKLQGEKIVEEILNQYFIVRTSWLFSQYGNNFLKTILSLVRLKPEISVVSNQFGSPTYAPDLAVFLCELIQTEKYGIYHATNEGFCSWYEFACEIVSNLGLQTPVIPVSSSQYPAIAMRPENSRLSKDKLLKSGFSPLPPWREAVARCIKLLREA